MQWILESDNWDDYNELFYAAKYFESVRNDKDSWFDSHLLYKADRFVEVLFIVGGVIKKLEKRYTNKDEAQALSLKYFHIVEKGKGWGSLWLNEVIFPYYRDKGFSSIYVNSSHKASPAK